MNDDTTPIVLAALDSEPDSRLAISLHNLGRADDAQLIGLDLAKSYARTTDPATLAGEQAADVARLRRAMALAKNVLLEGKAFNIFHRKNTNPVIRAMASGTEAREMVQRIVAGEPVLARIASDRYTQQTRDRLTRPEYLEYIESTLDSDPDARLAISLSRLDHEEISRVQVREVQAWIKEVDLTALEGQLADDAGRIRRATEILNHQILLDGMTFGNLQANVWDLRGNLADYATSTPAREIIDRIAAAVPGMTDLIAGYEPETAF
ncbi:hypothetical protein GCM10023063_19460 [Arthrobacter methylotrophus]|uniref:DUF222 domain-containing protein n=1 Tax=Arthrobacter methylotrophus TaxID=121291 RepID=A0ABV5URK3_9MICC